MQSKHMLERVCFLNLANASVHESIHVNACMRRATMFEYLCAGKICLAAIRTAYALPHATNGQTFALYAAHATSFSRASRYLLLTRVTLPVREPPARGAAGQAMHFDVRTAGCAWSREVQIKQ